MRSKGTIVTTISLVTMLLIFGGAERSAAAGGTISGKLKSRRSKYRKNAVVYLHRVPGRHKARRYRMDQRGQKFIPFVLPIVKGSTVAFLNNDNTGHNVYSPDHEKYDLGTWRKGQVRTRKYTRLGSYTQLCKMHPSMLAYVMVLQNPYFAVTGRDGKFTIRNVPPGTYTVKVWHERRKATPQKVTVTASGTATLELKMHR